MTSTVRRLLVTGASGFVGRATLPLLVARGFEVHAVSSSPRSTPEVDWHRYDLLDAAQCKSAIAHVKPTHLMHLAWIATPGQFWGSPLNLQWLASSVALIDAFYQSGGERALGVGTCAEYTWGPNDYSEAATLLMPDTVYGRCKHALSLAFSAAATTYGASGTWARLFFPYGPGEPPQRFIPSVIRGLLRDKPVECTAGTQVRDFVFVEDVAEALVGLLESEASGAFNIGSGCPTTLGDVVAIIVAQLGKKHLVHFGARPPTSGDPARVVADMTKLQRETGWHPHTVIETGIQRTIEYWRRHLALEGNA